MSNNMPSTSNSFLQCRSHLTSKRTKFISPLMASVNDNVSGSSSHHKDHRSSKVEQVTAEPSSRRVGRVSSGVKLERKLKRIVKQGLS